MKHPFYSKMGFSDLLPFIVTLRYILQAYEHTYYSSIKSKSEAGSIHARHTYSVRHWFCIA